MSNEDARPDVACSAELGRGGLYDAMANSHPSLSRGQVWCTECGRSERVDSARALRHGWPKCCGFTMTIDSPDERARLTPAGAP